MGNEVTIAIEGNNACLPHALQTRKPRPSVCPLGLAGSSIPSAQLRVIRTVLATVMMVVMVMVAVMVPGRIVGAVLCRGRSSAAEGQGKGNCKGRTNASNEFHFSAS
jgi:hypothetical protein